MRRIHSGNIVLQVFDRRSTQKTPSAAALLVKVGVAAVQGEEMTRADLLLLLLFENHLAQAEVKVFPTHFLSAAVF